jgi:hypothetical protein
MNCLRKAWLRLTKILYRGEGALVLLCDSCGYMILRRLVGLECEDYFNHPENYEGVVCYSCEKGHFSVHLYTEKGFKKKYPYYIGVR